MYDADIGHDWLRQHSRYILGRKGCFKRSYIIKFNHLGSVNRVNLWPHIVWTGHGGAFFIQNDECFIDRTMIAVIKYQHLLTASDHAGHPQHKTVGIRRCQRKLPKWQAKSTLQFFTDCDDILIRQHQRGAFFNLTFDSFQRWAWGMTGHCACIPQAKIDIIPTVHILEMGSFGLLNKHRK